MDLTPGISVNRGKWTTMDAEDSNESMDVALRTEERIKIKVGKFK